MDVGYVIENISSVLQYFVPGYLTIMVVCFAMSKKVAAQNMLIMSCVVSYTLLAAVSLLRIRFMKQIPDTVLVNSGISILIGVALACFLSCLIQRKWFQKITVKLFHKTFHDDIWRDVFDLENGSNLKVYLKEQDYYLIGHLKNYEEKGNDSWLALKSFAKYDKETNANYKNEPSYLNEKNVMVTVRMADVEHIEIF